MQNLWEVSHIVLWVIVLLNLIVTAVLFRQLGVVYLRLGASGSAADTESVGPELGYSVQAREIGLLESSTLRDPLSLQPALPSPIMLVFITPHCPTCERVVEGLRRLHEVENDVSFVLVASALPKDMSLPEGLNVAVSSELFEELEVGLTPYAVLLDTSATVAGKGVVNNTEQLESVLRTIEIGYATEEDRGREQSLG